MTGMFAPYKQVRWMFVCGRSARVSNTAYDVTVGGRCPTRGGLATAHLHLKYRTTRAPAACLANRSPNNRDKL